MRSSVIRSSQYMDDAPFPPPVEDAAEAEPYTGRPYYVYVLSSQGTDRSYVGFTVNPKRRLRQHNGVIKGGAKRTKKHNGYRWSFACLVTGFTCKHDALAFEWALQHPYKSKRYRDAMNSELKGKRGLGARGSLKRRMLELHIMLRQHPELRIIDPLTSDLTNI